MEEFFRILESIDKEYYSFKDVIVALHACTTADTTVDAINAWLRFKNSASEDEFFCNAIDACVFYHLRRAALSMGNEDDAENFRQRMVDSWNSVASTEEEHITTPEEIYIEDSSFMDLNMEIIGG